MLAAEVFLSQLKREGVDFFFCNPGTDFPPIIEAYAIGGDYPQAILVPHENLGVAMAHGATLMTGEPQCFMVHVNVGTANCINNLANLSRDNIPLLLAAGKTPWSEAGQFGSRNRPIHWAQEMFDQAGMVRELVKWDYELKIADDIAPVTSRAIALTKSGNPAPVYLILPREPLSATITKSTVQPSPLQNPPQPNQEVLEEVKALLAKAENILVITGGYGRFKGENAALTKFSESHNAKVVMMNSRYLAISTTHANFAGLDAQNLLSDADVIICLESDAPYLVEPKFKPTAKVITIARDPLFTRYPLRTFRSDILIEGEVKAALTALTPSKKTKQSQSGGGLKKADKSKLTPQLISQVICEILAKEDIIFNEYPLQLDFCKRELPDTYFGLSPAGGLGWGLGAALGAKLAAPDKTIIATLGDGAFIFSNPTAGFYMINAYNLPILMIIFNNARYGAVRRSTLSMFQNGESGKIGGDFLAKLDPSSNFAGHAKAANIWGEDVNSLEELLPKLTEAYEQVKIHNRPALLNINVDY